MPRNESAPSESPTRFPRVPSSENAWSPLLQVVYLVYNEGYVATAGETLARRDLAEEALSLCRLLVDLLPEPEAIGLLALILLHESRRTARTDAGGDVVPLEQQDRSLWDQERVNEGVGLVFRALQSGRFGSYTLQAAIAAVHAAAPSVEATDWVQIVRFYDMLLLRRRPRRSWSSTGGLQWRCGTGPEAGLVLVDGLLDRGELADYLPAHAVRADLNRRLGRSTEATKSYRRALELALQEPERRFLKKRLAEHSG